MNGDQSIWQRRGVFVGGGAVLIVGAAASALEIFDPVRDAMRATWFVGWPLACLLGTLALAVWRIPATVERGESKMLRTRLKEREATLASLAQGRQDCEARLTLSPPHVGDPLNGTEITSVVNNYSRSTITNLKVESHHDNIRVVNVVPTTLFPAAYRLGIGADGEPYERLDEQPNVDTAVVTLECDGPLPSEWNALLTYTVCHEFAQVSTVRGESRWLSEDDLQVSRPDDAG